jgi:transglutaminase-like putative cysteine protease
MNKTRRPAFGRMRNLGRWLAASGAVGASLILAVFVPASPRPAAPAPEADRWYVIKIAGNPAGYIREQVEAKTAPRGQAKPAARLLVTTSDMRLVLNRLGRRIELRFLSSSEESAEGILLRTSYVMLASNQSTKSDAVIADGKIEITNEAGGKAYTNSLTYTGQLSGPEGIRRLAAEKLKNPGDKIVVPTFVPEASLVGDLTRTVLATEDIDIAGRPVPAIKVEETLQGMPVKRTGWLDTEGNLLRQEEPGPFGIMEIVRSEESAALATASGAELPGEIYQKSIVRTNIRLPRFKPIDRLRLKLAQRSPTLGWPDLGTGNQSVLKKTEGELELEIRRPAHPGGMTFPVAATPENRQFLEPNAYVQSDEPEIRRLAREVTGSQKDAFEAALALEKWTAEHMTFDLGIVFAPASEVFSSRRGTCVGYATILATLARALGIPSRVAMGYVYAEGMFGGHAWAEILAGKTWVPVDAAIVNAGVADATHLAIVSSSLVNGPGEMSLGPAQQIFGQVDISILEYETAGKTMAVPADAKPYTVEGNRYVNPWLGITLTKPGDFAFAKVDAIWPDPTIVGLAGPAGEKVRLEEQAIYPWQEPRRAAAERLARLAPGAKSGVLELGERGAEKSVPAIYAPDGKLAAAAFGRGAELLVLRVDGPDAANILRALAQGLEFSLQ